MKNLILFIALVMVSTFAKAQNNALDATGVVKTRHAQFLSVKNSSIGAFTKGMAVCLDLTDDDGINADLCSAEGAKPIGVVVSTSCAIGQMCKLQTKGYFASGDFDYIATTLVAGGMVYATTSGKLVFPAIRSLDMFPVGSALDGAVADSAALEIYIDL